MHDLSTRRRSILVTCGRGIAPLLAAEVSALKLPARIAGASAVSTRGTLIDAMRLNLALRCAQRVLLEIGHTDRATDAAALYDAAVVLPWEAWLPVDGRFSITVNVRNPTIRDTRYAALKLKDAIADRMTDRLGRRPDAGAQRLGAAVIHLHWQQQRAVLFLDASGETLSRRGYRTRHQGAPLQEALGAALLRAADWTPAQALVNPMCGSGTLAIEAALWSRGAAPGLQRETFGFLCLCLGETERDAWREMRAQAARARIDDGAPIVASDHQPAAIDCARANARQAGVEAAIVWQTCDFAQTHLPPAPGLILLNPAYGERLGDVKALRGVYARLGTYLRDRPAGYAAGLLGGNPELNASLGLTPNRVLHFSNGPIRCDFLVFDRA